MYNQTIYIHVSLRTYILHTMPIAYRFRKDPLSSPDAVRISYLPIYPSLYFMCLVLRLFSFTPALSKPEDCIPL